MATTTRQASWMLRFELEDRTRNHLDRLGTTVLASDVVLAPLVFAAQAQLSALIEMVGAINAVAAAREEEQS